MPRTDDIQYAASSARRWQLPNHRIPLGDSERGDGDDRGWRSDCHPLGNRRFTNRNAIVERDKKGVRVPAEIVTIYAQMRCNREMVTILHFSNNARSCEVDC
jgi:hypothetical protein